VPSAWLYLVDGPSRQIVGRLNPHWAACLGPVLARQGIEVEGMAAPGCGAIDWPEAISWAMVIATGVAAGAALGAVIQFARGPGR